MENENVQEVSAPTTESDQAAETEQIETLSENDNVQEVSAPTTESDQAAETEGVNDTLSEIKEILLESKEASMDDTVSVQEVPLITEEEFIKFNNNFCMGITCVVLISGIICGSVISLLFKGMFKGD